MAVLDATARLNASLDEVAAALARPDADALLAAESGLAAALDDLEGPCAIAPEDCGAVAAALMRARATLARCRVLGASLADAARLTLAVNGGGSGYGPDGDANEPAAAVRGHRLRTRV